MAQTIIEYAIFGLSLLVILRQLPRIMRYLREGPTGWTALGLLVFCVGGFVGSMTPVADITGVKLVYTLFAIVAFLAPLFSKEPAPAHAISGSSVVYVLLLWAWLAGVNIAHNAANLSEGDLLIRLAPGVVWLALLAARSRSPMDRRMLAVMVTFAAAVPGLLIPFLSNPWRPCDETKCGVFDGMLVGPYVSENLMGMQIAFVTVLHLVSFGFKRTIYLLPLSVLWLLATESRTAQNALLAAAAILFLSWLGRRAVRSDPDRTGGAGARAFLTVLPVGFILVAVYLAFTSEPGAFSGRGHVWERALIVLRGNEITGLGVDSWAIFQRAGLVPSHLGQHSLYVFLLFSGGIVALVLLALFARQAMISAMVTDGRMRSGLALGAAFLTIGLLEVAWNPVAIDALFWVPLALVIADPQLRQEHGPVERPVADQAARPNSRRGATR